MFAIPKVTFDTSNLMRAQAIFDRHSSQTPTASLARTVLFVVRAAQDMTRPMSMQSIDTKMQAVTVERLVLKGPRAGQSYKKPKRDVHVVAMGVAMKIIIARMWPGSKANLLTDHRYAIDRKTFSPGGGKVGFFKAVADRAIRMVKAKHSSAGFLKHSWTAIMDKLNPLVPPRYRAYATGRAADVNPLLGMVQIASNPAVTVITIENRVGEDARFPNITNRHAYYAAIILGPILQQAIDAEFDSKMLEAANRGWLDQRPELAACGVSVAA